MKCKWTDCENDARAKSPFCSATCKKRYQRASGTDVPPEVGQGQVGQTPDVPPASLEDYTDDHGRKYVPRNEPVLLNWGPGLMNRQQLEKAGLKANRVAMPGDWDYDGVCEKVGGVWVYKSTGQAAQAAGACV